MHMLKSILVGHAWLMHATIIYHDFAEKLNQWYLETYILEVHVFIESVSSIRVKGQNGQRLSRNQHS